MGEGSQNTDRYVFKALFFDENELRTRIRTFANAGRFEETAAALAYAYEKHAGQYRKPVFGSDERIPYIVHPMTMCAQAHACGIDEDALLAAVLLHDVVEDTDTTLEGLPFSHKVKELVGLMTCEYPKGMSREDARMHYFGKLSSNPQACVIKLLDRCNNISTLAASFDSKKTKAYIAETEKFVLPLADVLRKLSPEYEKVAFQTKYQIVSTIETIKFLMT